MHSNFFLFLYSVLFHTVHICTASIHSEFSILMLQTISLIMLCSASLLFTVLLFLHFFIPLCSPITFLKAHCPVTKCYCIHHFSVFYFLSATDNIFLTFVTLVTRWANCLDFKSAWHHVRQTTELGTELLPYFSLWYTSQHWIIPAGKVLGHMEKNQNKTRAVDVNWSCQLSQKLGFVRCCNSGCNLFSILLKHIYFWIQLQKPMYSYSLLECFAAIKVWVFNRVAKIEWHDTLIINQNNLCNFFFFHRRKNILLYKWLLLVHFFMKPSHKVIEVQTSQNRLYSGFFVIAIIQSKLVLIYSLLHFFFILFWFT